MKKAFYIQLCFVVLTVLVALLSTPYLKQFFVDDGTRIDLMCAWSNDKTIQPDIAVFGGSGTMSGVNGFMIKDQLGMSMVSYTCTGQSTTLGSLFYTSVPESTKIVLQCYEVIANLEKSEAESVGATRLVYNGYQLDSITKSFIGQSNVEKFNESKLHATFELRGFMKEGINTILRDKVFRPNPCADSIRSMMYPYAYVYERAPESQYAKYLIPKEKADTLKVSDYQLNRFKMFNNYFKQRGIAYYLILMPTNPFMYNRVPIEYRPQVEEFSAKTGIPYLDLTDLLTFEEFYDPNHVNRAGAIKVTNEICEFIKNMNDN